MTNIAMKLMASQVGNNYELMVMMTMIAMLAMIRLMTMQMVFEEADNGTTSAIPTLPFVHEIDINAPITKPGDN